MKYKLDVYNNRSILQMWENFCNYCGITDEESAIEQWQKVDAGLAKLDAYVDENRSESLGLAIIFNSKEDATAFVLRFS